MVSVGPPVEVPLSVVAASFVPTTPASVTPPLEDEVPPEDVVPPDDAPPEDDDVPPEEGTRPDDESSELVQETARTATRAQLSSAFMRGT
jgi:hypothetical protein